MQSLGLNTATNYSWYAVPAAFGIAFAPHLYAIALLNCCKPAGKSGFDFSNPKNSRAKISESGLSPADVDRYNRAESANDNGFISLPLFAAAVVAGNVARVPIDTLNCLAAVYLGSRAAFNLLYILGTNNAMGLARTAAWMTSTIASLSLFVRAGKNLQPLI